MTPDEKYAAKKEAHRKYSAECRAWMKAHGICTHCGRERAAPNRVNCSECLYKASERARKKRENMTEEERKIKNAKDCERRRRKVENGICVLCNRPIYAHSKSLCYEHYIYRLNYDRELRAKKKRERPETVRVYIPPKPRPISSNHPWRKLDSQIFRAQKSK